LRLSISTTGPSLALPGGIAIHHVQTELLGLLLRANRSRSIFVSWSRPPKASSCMRYAISRLTMSLAAV
jgi:hypothetical protein